MRKVRCMMAAVAACTASAAMADELSIAQEALRDGLWDVARAHAANVVSNVSAKLIILESWVAEGKWDAAARTLAGWPDARGIGFDYYRAVVAGDHAAAAKILRQGHSTAGVAEAKLYEASELAGRGDRAAAEAIWREIAADTNSTRRTFATAAACLMDPSLLRRAYEAAATPRERLSCGLRLGQALLKAENTSEEGARLVRAAVRDSPDTEGALDAFLAIAEADLSAGRWKNAADVYAEAAEIWPDAAKRASVQDGRGWALLKLGRREEALAAFEKAEEMAKDDSERATALLKQGDVLSELGRGDDAMEKYRAVVLNYPKAPFAERIRKLVSVRENEAKGRELYKNYRFEEARRAFAEVGREDPSKRARMDFYEVLCLYGQGADSAAAEKAAHLASECKDRDVRGDAALWLAKFRYNRRDWKAAARLFTACADAEENGPHEAEALMWASRASLAENDFPQAIALSTRLAKRHPKSPERLQALLVQGEALIALARFDEAVLVLDSVAASESEALPPADRVRAQTLRADALYAMGADNPAHYSAALEAYRSIRFGGELRPGERLVVAFKIARVLEKLKRTEEAIDQYYSQVILAYRDGRLRHERFDDEARAAYSRAAFRLADEFESRGRDRQAVAVLELVATSDVPAADEAARRIERISKKGRFP